MRLLTVSSRSCCWRCSAVLLEETLRSCCSSSPMMAVCRRIRARSCSFSFRSIFSSTCLCCSISSTFFSRKLRRGKRFSRVFHFVGLIVGIRKWCIHLFLSFSLLMSFVWTISCFSNLLVDKEFSSS